MPWSRTYGPDSWSPTYTTRLAVLEAELDAAVPRDLGKGFDDINLEIEGMLSEKRGASSIIFLKIKTTRCG